MNLTERRDWMGLLARAAPARLAELLRDLPAHDFARRPEIGTVMVRARAGGTGAAFNLGEMTVTRCTLRLPSGTVGHAYVQGRDKAHATRAAVVDALMQDDPDTTRATILTPLAQEAEARTATRCAKAAATKVEFFTLVRGDN
ncbi:phosphonate C-P lyase system protein PhnG [Falsirhodobacter sp. 20TX0035]|uniref:phosphonate C-P lyase system protein PhnG n=1 Tax=Falsirhodobacter sp. 20TX0035 TaxID=3022019 RepID=UPI00232C26B9|nr:phosphonate C-P lyase system protein PhnG [Falsirhodobacter sp. 20TX0035]MDB6452721.1 phosphonate C-P lyase system protein PhnG [Falsirhodobacter sp. 20TX0035]